VPPAGEGDLPVRGLRRVLAVVVDDELSGDEQPGAVVRGRGERVDVVSGRVHEPLEDEAEVVFAGTGREVQAGRRGGAEGNESLEVRQPGPLPSVDVNAQTGRRRTPGAGRARHGPAEDARHRRRGEPSASNDTARRVAPSPLTTIGSRYRASRTWSAPIERVVDALVLRVAQGDDGLARKSSPGQETVTGSAGG